MLTNIVEMYEKTNEIHTLNKKNSKHKPTAKDSL